MSTDKWFSYGQQLQDYLISLGVGKTSASVFTIIISLIVVAIVAIVLDIILRKLIVQTFKAFSDKTRSTFDDYLIQSNFPRYVAHFIPVLLTWKAIPIIFDAYPKVVSLINKLVLIYIVILSILVFRSLLRTTKNFYETKPKFHDKPLESYIQVLMIFAWGTGIFLIINLITNYNVISITTLGAASAAILLIFKDTILGFVASIQVSVNDIVRIGDWITFSKFGADGYVTEINLATVKVQNFDNTITTVPTYSLIADSFQNWRGMQESKGRRIKRALYIKQNSVKFMSQDEINALKKVSLISPYLEHREKEINRHNRSQEVDKSTLINGRNQTNLGIFRTYAESFITENELINQDLFLMVRHLAPTEKGIPLEVFCFSYDKAWINYERIQADIFDHLIAAVPYFDLEIFESPSGGDFTNLSIGDSHLK